MKIDVLEKIDKHIIDYYKIETNKKYNIEYVNARDLLVPERIDLIAKYKYVEAYEKKYETCYFLELYKRTIEAFSNGMYLEPGKEEKNNFRKYVEQFNNLIDNIKKNGIDENISVVPVGANDVILDGAHRVSIAAYFNLKVPVVRFDNVYVDYGPYFFEQHLLSEEDIKYLITEYCKIKTNIFAICLWPRCDKQSFTSSFEYIKQNLNVIYNFSAKLNYNGLKNFMTQIYRKFEWIGTYLDNHKGTLIKVDNCYKDNGEINIILVKSDNVNEILKVKNDIRDMMKIENHSIHSTDDAIETKEMLELILNDNSLHFLNNSNPDKYHQFNSQLLEFKEIMIKNNINLDDIAIDSSSIMALYGIRENNDIDFLTNKKYCDLFFKNEIDIHNSELKFYQSTLDDLLYNPKNYFVYNGLKFITLNNLLIMKKNRNENKDKEDIILIVNKLKTGSKTDFKSFQIKLKRKFRNIKNLSKKYIKSILIKLRLFSKLKKIKQKIRRGNN